jgi:pimeloyl-ACP methyl ester carboxylesterase
MTTSDARSAALSEEEMARRRGIFAQEIPRATQEFGSFLAARRGLARSAKGDGRPVLFLPGFMGSDGSTLALRRLLKHLGYHTHAWRLGRNWGPTDKILDGLGERVRGLLTEHGQKLTIIGHSLGGVYARELARVAPQAVRQVITLGSPVRRPDINKSAVAPIFQALRPVHSDRVRDVDPGRISETIPVPLTAIFTKTDGVVPWKLCLPTTGPKVEIIEVKGSHAGLIHNPAAIAVILDRLGQESWAPFVEREGIGARIFVRDL